MPGPERSVYGARRRPAVKAHVSRQCVEIQDSMAQPCLLTRARLTGLRHASPAPCVFAPLVVPVCVISVYSGKASIVMNHE